MRDAMFGLRRGENGKKITTASLVLRLRAWASNIALLMKIWIEPERNWKWRVQVSV
jgi:site-specific recombinase